MGPTLGCKSGLLMRGLGPDRPLKSRKARGFPFFLKPKGQVRPNFEKHITLRTKLGPDLASPRGRAWPNPCLLIYKINNIYNIKYIGIFTRKLLRIHLIRN